MGIPGLGLIPDYLLTKQVRLSCALGTHTSATAWDGLFTVFPTAGGRRSPTTQK